MYKIVNLETFFIPQDEKYKLLKTEIGNADKVLGLMLVDGFIHENPGDVIKQIAQEVDLTIISGLAGSNTDYKQVISFDFNLHTTYQSYKDKNTKAWNKEAGKFLFLGGVPSRPNRVGLLNRYRRDQVLSQGVWTFFKPWTDVQEHWCRQYLKDEYDEVMSLEYSIDSVYKTSKHYGTDPSDNSWTKDTAWIDPNVFHDTSLSIVSEGIDISDITSKYLTEKTFRVFVQRHPFLHASNPEMFDYIKSLGFKTFEDYMLIKEYAYIQQEEQRLDAIVENTKYFLNNCHLYADSILNDIEHNYNRFFDLAKENEKILELLSKEYDIKQHELDYWFNRTGWNHLVRAYAN